MRTTHVVAIILIASSCGGCIVWPTEHRSYMNGPAGQMTLCEAAAILEPGNSTREEIATRLTIHGTSLGNGKVVAYTWSTGESTRLFILAVSLVGGGAGEFDFDWGERTDFLLLEFDDRDVLKRYKVQHGGALNYLATSLNDARLKR
ncbi:MAG: hypothetical protein NTU53_22015 [Planctomycetota bacterium]|nr:hypothetical protein [Planctomycetota bacterium]